MYCHHLFKFSGFPGGGTVGYLQIAHHMQKLGVEVTHTFHATVITHLHSTKLMTGYSIWLPDQAFVLNPGKTLSLAWSPHIHLFDVDEPANRLKLLKNLTDEWFRFRPLKRADITFALSNFTREELITLFGLESERVIVTYWGVDAMFAQVQRSFAGRCLSHLLWFWAPKGNLWLIEALACGISWSAQLDT